RNKEQTSVQASASFMHHIPMNALVRFNLSKYKTGDFTANIQLSGFDATTLNSITEPMGLFIVKKGYVQSASVRIDADNYKGKGKVLFLYNDMHLTPVKKDEERSDGFKKKSLFSFIANSFVIKNDNPAKGDTPRNPESVYKREPT